MKPLLSFEEYLNRIGQNRARLQRLFFGLALVSLLLNYRYGISLHQIGGNPILYQEVDPVYWLFMILKLPYWIGVRAPLLFDALLVLSCCCSVLWPGQNRSPILFFILHFVYFVLYNMMAGHHYVNVGLLFMSVPFMFASGKSAAFAFAAMRFLFCFMLFSAALWKIGRGTLFHVPQLTALLLPGYVENTVSGNTSFQTAIVSWLLQHPLLLHAFWIALIFSEAVFAAGFVTLRWDRILLISYLLFVIGGWALLNIYNYENLLFLLTLAPVVQRLTFSKPHAGA